MATGSGYGVFFFGYLSGSDPSLWRQHHMERAINGSTRDGELVDIAFDLASGIVRLECIRHELREHMQASPIMDEQRHS